MNFVPAIMGAVVLATGCANVASVESLHGWTKGRVEETYGAPDRQWEGNYGLPSTEFTRQYPKVVSCFHDLPNQDLYVTYQLRNYNWSVVCSSFVPKGSVF